MANFAGNKAYLCRARMTLWCEEVGELPEFHVDRDGTSLAECIGDFAPSDHAKASPELTTFGYFKVPPQGPFQKAYSTLSP
jgi:hypothetical protein